MEGIYENELRNLKSESTTGPSIMERVKGFFSGWQNKDQTAGRLNRRQNEEDIESQSLISTEGIKGLYT